MMHLPNVTGAPLNNTISVAVPSENASFQQTADATLEHTTDDSIEHSSEYMLSVLRYFFSSELMISYQDYGKNYCLSSKTKIINIHNYGSKKVRRVTRIVYTFAKAYNYFKHLIE